MSDGVSEYQIEIVRIDPRYACSRKNEGGWLVKIGQSENYSPLTSTCGGDWVAIVSTAFITLADHSSSPFSSSKNAMLNLLGHLRES